MAEEEVLGNPFEETAPTALGRLDAPLPQAEAAAVTPPSYPDTVQPLTRHSVNTVPPRDQLQLVQRTGSDSSSADETSPLINTRSAPTHRKKPQGTAKAFLLLLGIGQWYSGACIFFSFAFFSAGSVAIVLSIINFKVFVATNVATIAAGVVFILISILWPCSWSWDQCSRRTGCSYTPLLWYTWLLSLLYFGVIGALGISFTEHYDCVRYCEKTHCPKNSTEMENFCVYVRVPFVVLAVMVVLAVGLILLSCICCTGTSCEGEARGTRDQ